MSLHLDRPSIAGTFFAALRVLAHSSKWWAALTELDKLATRQSTPPFSYAAICAHLNWKGGALEWLERAQAQRDPACLCLAGDRMWDNLGREPSMNSTGRRSPFSSRQ